jgi:hypothetical protein
VPSCGSFFRSATRISPRVSLDPEANFPQDVNSSGLVIAAQSMMSFGLEDWSRPVTVLARSSSCER